ncbi:MAG: virulence-associated protein E [Pseudoleptotrichia goodfellowii]|nr:virulence-associated protein E [Pseudoleptotrichia goodfellowii]
MWYEFIDRLKTPHRRAETLEEYIKYPKSKQDNLKDVGGYVAGELKDGKRKNTNLLSRELITLDLDNIEPGKTKEIIEKIKSLKVSFVATSTCKHAEYKPRLRVVFLADRKMTPEEYEPVARKIGSIIGIEMCDPTTFEPVRLMYWPSCSSDSIYIYEYDKDSPAVNVDGMLALYVNWHDMSEWPQVPGVEKITERLLKKQENPLEKSGVIGAFCKNYSIVEAVGSFIPDVYEISDNGDRMTYTEGSTFGGVVIYDEVFAYSHHATDPTSGKLCNAFDLIRIHKFGDLDEKSKEGTPINKLPSFVEMSKFVRKIPAVASIVNMEIYTAADDFTGVDEDGLDIEWMSTLETNESGFKKTTNNALIILENDPVLKDKLALDEFANRAMVTGSLPWDNREIVRQYEEVDDSGLRNYMEKRFKITGERKINDALLLMSHKRRYNSVKIYLEGLKWDGIPRLETLLSDYLGAEDNVYTRVVIRVALTAAVARAIEGGVKYDYMPIFTGPQGIGKSTFLAKLGMKWYSDSLQTFEGKEAAEMIQGTWINELGELTGFTKSETNLIKQFLSKQEDIYREAYGRRTNSYPRRCVFFGTSNDWEFLRDKTGNRRFWPVEVGIFKAKKSIWEDLDNEVDQIWAEAYANYILGEDLFLTGEALEISKESQETHRLASVREGRILEFLDRKIPIDWYKWDMTRRLNFWNSEYNTEEIELVERDRVCALEILVECFKIKESNIKNSDSAEINSVLGSLMEWERIKTPYRFGVYGKQRGFKRR